jgi:hypothetical protein
MATPLDSLTRRARTRAAAALVGLALVLAACGGDDGTPVASGGSPTTSAAVGTACDEIQAAGIVAVVGQPYAEDEGPDEQEAVAAMGRLAASPPPDIAEPVATLDRLIGLDAGTQEDADAGMAAIDEVAEWAAGACADDGPFWACSGRSTVTPVSRSIDDTPVDGATAEEAAGEGEGERVEVQRAADEVVFAWLDERDMAVRSLVVVAHEGTWSRSTASECGGGSSGEEGFEDVGEAIETDVEGYGTDVEGYGGTDVEGYGGTDDETDVEGYGGTDVEGYGTDVEGYGGGQ